MATVGTLEALARIKVILRVQPKSPLKKRAEEVPMFAGGEVVEGHGATCCCEVCYPLRRRALPKE